MTTRRSDRGFTLIEILVALAITVVVGTAAMVGGGYARSLQRQTTMKQDLLNFADVQEAEFRQLGTYAAFDELLDTERFSFSNNVVADSVSIGEERLYLRVRHADTGEMCSIDYGRRSGQARNRPNCFDSKADEVLPVPDGDGVAMADTFHVQIDEEAPEGGAEPEIGIVLQSPIVSDPADQAGRPGDSFSPVFRVTSRSTAARAFAFRVSSSNPSVVPARPNPSDALIAAGATLDLTVPITISSGAQASAFSAISLQATDAADPSLVGRGQFTVATLLVMAAPTISSPADAVADPGTTTTLTWNVRNNANAPRVMEIVPTASVAGILTLVSGTNTGDVVFAAGEAKTVTATYSLAFESDGGTVYPLRLSIADKEMPEYSATDEANVTGRLILANPGIGAPASRTERPGDQFTMSWLVTNISNAARTLDITASLDAGADLDMIQAVNTGRRVIPRRSSLTVSLTYQVRSGSLYPRTSTARLTVTDAGSPSYTASQTASVFTALVLRNPAVSRPADVSQGPGGSFSATWSVTNQSNGSRTLLLGASVSNGSILTQASASGTGTISFGPNETRTVTTSYQVSSGAVAGTSSTANVSAADLGSGAYSGSNAFTFTTTLVERVPTVSAPGSKSYNPQSSYIETFRVKNPSNAPRTLRLMATSSNGGVVGDPGDPGNVSFSAFETRDIAVSFPVHWVQAGSTSSISLSAQNLSSGQSASASLTGTVTVDSRTPSIGGLANQSAYKGEWRYPSMTVTNHSNLMESFEFTYGSSNGGVVNNLATTQSCSAGMGQSCTAQHRMYAAQQGSAQVTVTVRRQRAGAASSASASYTATVPNRSPSISLNANRTSIEAGESVHLWASTGDPDGDGLWGYINTGDGLSYSWDIWKQYNNPGNYWVTAYVQDPYGGSATSNGFTVQVRDPICRDPGARNYGGRLPCWYNTPPDYLTLNVNTRWIYSGQSVLATVTFDDLPERDPLRGNVNRNDPNTAIEFGWTPTPGSASVWLTYSTPGDYPVTATVYDGYPGGQIWAWGGYVHVENPTCQDPGARNYGGPLPCVYNRPPSYLTLDVNTRSIYAGQSVLATVTFDDPDRDQLRGNVNRNDPNTPIDFGWTPTPGSASVWLTYANPGVYPVTATVWDAYGGQIWAWGGYVTVEIPPAPNRAPVASFEWIGGSRGSAPGCDGWVDYRSTSYDPDGDPITYHWSVMSTAMTAAPYSPDGGKTAWFQYWNYDRWSKPFDVRLEVRDNKGGVSVAERKGWVGYSCN